MSIDTLDILKIAVSSSVLTTVVTFGLTYVFVNRAGLKRDARYLAQRLAIILEKFAVDCADVIADNELFNSSSGAAGSERRFLPNLGVFPSDADWKAIDPYLMNRVMSMPKELTLADQRISFWWNVVGGEDSMKTKPTIRLANVGSDHGC